MCSSGAMKRLRMMVPPIRWKRTFMLKRALLSGAVEPKCRPSASATLSNSVIALPVYVVALPFAFVLGHHRFMTLLVSLFDHLGKLLALLGINPIKATLCY